MEGKKTHTTLIFTSLIFPFLQPSLCAPSWEMRSARCASEAWKTSMLSSLIYCRTPVCFFRKRVQRTEERKYRDSVNCSVYQRTGIVRACTNKCKRNIQLPLRWQYPRNLTYFSLVCKAGLDSWEGTHQYKREFRNFRPGIRNLA